MHRKSSSILLGIVLLSQTIIPLAFAGDDCIFIRDRDQRNLCKGDCIFIVDRELRDLCKGVTSETKKLPSEYRERREQDSHNSRYERQSRYDDSDSVDEEEGDSGSDEYYVQRDDERPANRSRKTRR